MQHHIITSETQHIRRTGWVMRQPTVSRLERDRAKLLTMSLNYYYWMYLYMYMMLMSFVLFAKRQNTFCIFFVVVFIIYLSDIEKELSFQTYKEAIENRRSEGEGITVFHTLDSNFLARKRFPCTVMPCGQDCASVATFQHAAEWCHHHPAACLM